MPTGIIGKKLGMTSIFDEQGNQLPCTVVEIQPNVVTQVRTEEVDGYSAVQLAYGPKKAKRTTKALAGHFSKAGTEPKRFVREMRDFDGDVALGDELKVSDLFADGDIVHVTGTSKGKGFQGVVRRHGFSGVGMRTHGQHNRERAPGSIGAASTPSRVFKGTKMGGRMGGSRVTTKNLTVVRVMEDQNLLLIQGSVPGPRGGFVMVRKK